MNVRVGFGNAGSGPHVVARGIAMACSLMAGNLMGSVATDMFVSGRNGAGRCCPSRNC